MTLADLRRAAELLPPGSALTLSRDAILEALGNVAPAPAEVPTEADTWLTADETAAVLHVSARWCYDHADQLGGRRLSRRCIRFSRRRVDAYLARRRS